jgi:predicted alpha/beta superfamily hydrolase
MGHPWPLRDSETFEYHSKAVGDAMAIGVWLPPEEVLARAGLKDKPLDLVYVLDGAWALAEAVGISRLLIGDDLNPGFPPVMLVGLDYPVGQMNARNRDYNPVDAAPPSWMPKLSAFPQTTPGGADKFLTFFESELDPLLRSKYRVSDRPAAILGHSAGGTFSFYAFLKKSKVFDRYWLGSPGLFTTKTDYIAKFAAVLKSNLVHPTRMYLSMGSLELNGGIDYFEDMGRHYLALVSALHTIRNDRLQWTSKIYNGYGHRAIIAPALNDALLYLCHST